MLSVNDGALVPAFSAGALASGWYSNQNTSHDSTGTGSKNTENICQILETLRCASCCGHQMPKSWDETEKYLATLNSSFSILLFLPPRNKGNKGQTSMTCSPVAFAHPVTALKIWVVFEEDYFKFANQWTGPLGRTLVTVRHPKMIALSIRRKKETLTHKDTQMFSSSWWTRDATDDLPWWTVWLQQI